LSPCNLFVLSQWPRRARGKFAIYTGWHRKKCRGIFEISWSLKSVNEWLGLPVQGS
jgi:hypothetical protein